MGGSIVRTVAVIMAGGKGERFWPRSTASMPKQFLHLWGEGILLQQAFERAMKVTARSRVELTDISTTYLCIVPQ